MPRLLHVEWVDASQRRVSWQNVQQLSYWSNRLQQHLTVCSLRRVWRQRRQTLVLVDQQGTHNTVHTGYRLTASARMDVGLSQLPARRRGTHCQHTFVVWRTAPLHLDDHLRFICFLSIQRIRGFGDNALYKSTFYLLTYLLANCTRTHKHRTTDCIVTSLVPVHT